MDAQTPGVRAAGVGASGAQRGKNGRPPHPATAEIAELLANPGMTVRKVVDVMRERGVPVGRMTVHRIRHGQTQKAPSLLATGERRLSQPVPCPNCRAPIVIVPCRACGATWPVELDDLQRTADRRQLVLSQQRPHD